MVYPINGLAYLNSFSVFGGNQSIAESSHGYQCEIQSTSSNSPPNAGLQQDFSLRVHPDAICLLQIAKTAKLSESFEEFRHD
jgi:hypothetical protein